MSQALTIDHASREVHLNGSALSLTKIEFDLLSLLMGEPRVVVTTHALLQAVWGDEWWGEDHQVEVHISRLRRKLGESGDHPNFIRTIRGVGYRYEPGAGARNGSLDHSEPDGVAYLVVAVDGTIAWASDSIREAFGWQPHELVGMSIASLIGSMEFLDQQARIGTIADTMLRCADEREIPVCSIIRPIKTHTVVQSFLVELFPEAKRPKAHSRAVLPILTTTHQPSVDLSYDSNLVVVGMSPRDAPFLSWRTDEILGTFFLLTTDQALLDDQAKALALAQAIVDAGIRRVHDRMLARSASGSAIPVHVHSEFLVDEQGRFMGLQANVTPE